MSLRAVIYARVSSGRQRDAQTIEAQLRVLRLSIAARGWILVGEYTDDGKTAKTGHLAKREGLARLHRDATAGKFDVVVVVATDRLTRTDDVYELAEVYGPLQRAGVRVAVDAGEPLDMSTLHGSTLLQFANGYAAEDNRRRRARALAGQALAIARGRKPCGATPFGLTYDRDGKVFGVDAATGPIVREIFDRVIRGETCPQIAVDVTGRGYPLSSATVHRMIRETTYRGQWIAARRTGAVVEVPAIVDEATWRAAQDALDRRRTTNGATRTRHAHNHMLTGLMVCGVCGARVGIASAQGGRWGSAARYVCARRFNLAKGQAERCTGPYRYIAEVDAAVWERLAATLNRDDVLGDAVKLGRDRLDNARALADDAKTWRRKLARLDDVEAQILARYRRGDVGETAMDRELAAIKRERTALRAQLDAAERGAAGAAALAQRARAAEALLSELRGRLATADAATRRKIVEALVAPGDLVLGADGRVRGRAKLVIPTGSDSVMPSRGACSARQPDGVSVIVELRVVA